MAKDKNAPEETEFEKRIRETAESNLKLEGESDAQIKRATEAKENLAKANAELEKSKDDKPKN